MLVESSKTQWIGKQAEDVAARWLEQRGFSIVERNVRLGNGELDIVARKGKLTVFVEVKARRSGCMGRPEEAVTPKKLDRLRSAMRAYIMRERLPWEQVRLDVLGLLLVNGDWAVDRHVEDVLV